VGAFIYKVLLNKYYIDELYGLIIRYILFGLANFAALFDRYVIDGIVNGSASLVRGIGRATARAFARADTRLVLVDRDAGAGEEARDAIRRQGADAVFIAADVTRSGEVQTYVKAALDTHGRRRQVGAARLAFEVAARRTRNI